MFEPAIYFISDSVGFFTTLSTSERLEATSIWASFLLTFALIVVYRDIGATQSEQTTEMNEQRKLIESRHEPVIQVLLLDSSGGFIWPKLRNIGNGLARNLTVVFHFYAEEADREINSKPARLTHSADSDAVDVSVPEAAEIDSLSPGETGKLAAEIRIPSLNGDEYEPISVLMEELQSKNIQEIVFQVEITYDHLMPTRGKGRQFLKPRKIGVRPGLSVENMVKNSEILTDYSVFDEASNLREPRTYYDTPLKR
jgi:hypothetical protein